jgi:hypothetical protein
MMSFAIDADAADIIDAADYDDDTPVTPIDAADER